MAELFDWPTRNAQSLMQDEALRQNFIELISKVDRIVLHEDFAGMGTCGTSLVAQFNAMCLEVAHLLPPGTLLT